MCDTLRYIPIMFTVFISASAFAFDCGLSVFHSICGFYVTIHLFDATTSWRQRVI